MSIQMDFLHHVPLLKEGNSLGLWTICRHPQCLKITKKSRFFIKKCLFCPIQNDLSGNTV